MKRYALIFTALLVVFAAALGCHATDRENESNRSVVVVESMNGGSPFFSDVLDQGDTLYSRSTGLYFARNDFVVEDIVPVSFFNRPYDFNVLTAPGAPCGDFLVTEYSVAREVVQNNSTVTWNVPDIPSAATSIMVPSSEIGTGGILLVPFSSKAGTNLWSLRMIDAGGVGGEIVAVAHLNFLGNEAGTDHEIEIATDLTASFGDIIETEEK
jgi:hypothetical protein